MKIVVTTPTGNIGRSLVDSLLLAGVRPTVIVRDPSKLAAHVLAGVDVVQGDQTDPSVLDQALAGATSLFWLTPPNYGSADPIGAYESFGKAGSAAVDRNGVKRVVHLSSYGAEANTGFGLIDGLAINEALFDATSADVRHLRAGFFYENFHFQAEALASGNYYSGIGPEQVIGFVATRDIAATTALYLLNPEWSGKESIYVRSGPAMTVSEAVRQASIGLGREINLVQIPREAVEQAMLGNGASAAVASKYGEMMEAFNGYSIPERDALGGPTDLASWAFSNLKQ